MCTYMYNIAVLLCVHCVNLAEVLGGYQTRAIHRTSPKLILDIAINYLDIPAPH